MHASFHESFRFWRKLLLNIGLLQFRTRLQGYEDLPFPSVYETFLVHFKSKI